MKEDDLGVIHIVEIRIQIYGLKTWREETTRKT